MLKTTLASLLLAGSLVACSDRAPQIIAVPTPSDIAKPGSFVVQGTATLDVSPDCADLTMTITADGARPGAATSGVQSKEAQLVAALEKLGVQRGEIKLSTLNLSPIYAPNAEGWSTLKVATYRATITLTATTRNFDQIGPMMEAGANAGASGMSSQFRRSDLAEQKKKVREMAIAAARDKAAQTAKALGVELGRIVSVGETPNGYMWGAQYFPANARGVVEDKMTPLGGESQQLTLEVTIGYEIATKA